MENKQMIFEALCDVMTEIEAVTKSKTNAQQNYKYRSIDDVYNMIQPIFGKHKIFILPKVIEIKEEERQSKSGGVLYYTTLTIDYSFYASDGSSVTTTAVGKAMDSGDKSLDKAKSSAMKYLLLQMFVIPTEEDKDIERDNPEPKEKPQPPAQDDLSLVYIAKINEVDNIFELKNWVDKHTPELKKLNKDDQAIIRNLLAKRRTELQTKQDKINAEKARLDEVKSELEEMELDGLDDGSQRHNPPV